MKSVVKNLILTIFIFLLNKNLQASSCIPSGTTVTLTRQSEVDSFPINYPGCDTINGAIIISGSNIVNLNGLNLLKFISYLGLRNTSLLNLYGLINLKYVNTLDVYGNPILIDFFGLTSLDYIGRLQVNSNSVLRNFNGLQNVIEIPTFEVRFNTRLENFFGLEYVKRIIYFDINQNNSLINFSGLLNLKYIYSFNINYNPLLSSFIGLSKIDSIFELDLISNPSIINFDGMQNLKDIDHFEITGNSGLINFKGLERLTSLKQHNFIRSNNTLKNFEGLQNIKNINDIYISYNSMLKNFYGLSSVKIINYLDVHYNSLLLNLFGLNTVDSIEALHITYNQNLKNVEGLEHLSYFGNINILNNSSICSINELNENVKTVPTGNSELFIRNNPNLTCCKRVNEILGRNNNINLIIDNNSSGCNDTSEIRTITTQNCCSTKYTLLKDTICSGEQIIFNNQILKNTGTYYDTFVRNGNDSIVILELKVFNKSYQIKTLNFCIGQSFTLSNGKIITTNGIYKDTIPNVCDSIIEYRLTFLNNITTSINTTICKGKTYTLPKGNVVSNAGIYKDTLRASFGCDSIITTNLTVTNLIPFNNNVTICSGKTYTLPKGNIVKTSGIYRDTIIKSNTCDSIVITNLTVNPYLQSTQTVSICLGKSFTLPSGKNVNQSGIYKDTIKNLNGCDSIITTNLTIANPITNNINVSICDGQTHTLPNGKQVSTTGVYTDTIKKLNTCDSIVITNLNVFSNTFNISLNPIDTIEAGNSIELKPFYSNQIAASWNWTPTQNLSCTTCENPIATPTETTQYIVNAKAPNGCEDTATTTIAIRQTNVYMPDAFSPNNDGVNDLLKVFVVNPKTYSLKIYNRYGELVFECNDVNSKWNGTYKGENCEVDTYSFILDVTQHNGKQTHQQGIVLLVR